MLKIEVKQGGIEKALKELKRKFTKVGITKELKDRQHYTKKSVARRDTIKRARYIQKLKDQNGKD